jgi:predicted nucleic acid-binding protein
MKPKVYLETSVISYLTAWPSRDLVKAAHQQVTQEWWNTRERFDLYISQVVLREAGSGDPAAARLRLESLSGIPILTASPEASALAQQLVARGSLPTKAAVDAVHIAVAVVNGMDYLLTWNCTHIANAAMRHKIEAICRQSGYEPVVLCTPEQLMEE